MKRLLWSVAACLASYQGGCVLGHRLGVANGKALCDYEWARMLENGMVGPGSTARPSGSVTSFVPSGGAV